MRKTSPYQLMLLRKQQIAKLPPWTRLIRGSLVRYYLTCGNPNCRCRKGQRYRHGPYWYVTVSYAAGKQKRYLISARQARRAREGIAAYKCIWKGLCRISELNLALLKADGREG